MRKFSKYYSRGKALVASKDIRLKRMSKRIWLIGIIITMAINSTMVPTIACALRTSAMTNRLVSHPLRARDMRATFRTTKPSKERRKTKR